MSPVFKSDAAKEIIQEVGVGTNGHRKILRRSKKRSMTITSSHPAMLEALQNHNEKVSWTWNFACLRQNYNFILVFLCLDFSKV